VRAILDRLLDEREAKGVSTYGTKLMTHNGRNALLDALQESLDANMYLAGKVGELEDEIAALKAPLSESEYNALN
jgi:hypothetical protein